MDGVRAEKVPRPQESRLAGAWSNRFEQLTSRVREHSWVWVSGAAAWMAYAAYQLWIVVRGPIGYWNDTASYVSVARSPFPSLQLLAGKRSPLVPLLWKLTGTPLRFAVAETALSIVAWSALALVVARAVAPGFRRLLAGSAILAFASCWQVTEWNWNVLSESLGLSATAIACAGAIAMARRPGWRATTALLIGAVLLVADRDQAILVVGPAGLGLCSWALVGWLRRDAEAKKAFRYRMVATLLVGVGFLSVAAVGEIAAYSSHRNVINVEDVFYVRVFPNPALDRWFGNHGMPQSRAIAALARTTPAAPGEAKIVGINLADTHFRSLDRWFRSDGQGEYLDFVLTHPGYDLSAPFARPELTFDNANGDLAYYGSLTQPGHANHALPFLPVVFFPSWRIVIAVGLLLASLGPLVARLRKLSQVLIWLAVIGLWSMLVAWHGDGMEIARHTIEGGVLARLAVLIGLIVLLLGSDRNAVPGGAPVLRRGRARGVASRG